MVLKGISNGTVTSVIVTFKMNKCSGYAPFNKSNIIIYHISKDGAYNMSDANSYIQWIGKKLKLNNYAKRNQAQLMNWKLNRCQIYTCYLGENIGFEKSRIVARPCIIVSAQQINHESGNIIVIPLSKTIKYVAGTNKLKYPYHYVLYQSKYSKLQHDSAVQCEDIRCISKARLCNYVCNVQSDDMKEINKRN